MFSPLLDAQGNSVRGVRVFEDLTEEYGFHMFDLSLGRCKFSQAIANGADQV
ncbi:MAG: glutaminase [Elainellaceae cyanobacterium]